MSTVNMIRAGAYGCGVVGLIIVLLARRMHPAPQGLFLAGSVLIVAMVLLFMAAYVVYFAGVLRRRTGRFGGGG